MALAQKNQFSRLGFILAAAGSAVGLGNIYSFPSQVANNGGAAFILVYLVLTVLIVYPALVAEIAIGRHTRANIVNVYNKLGKPKFQFLGVLGFIGIVLILSFYAIVGGWIVQYMVKSLFGIVTFPSLAKWISMHPSIWDVITTASFYFFTVAIIVGGLKQGIEMWSKILMPLLFIILIFLILYVVNIEGANQGVQAYLIPEFSKIFDLKLLVSAMGQAFFSASLGVGVMLVYGSYLGKNESIPRLSFFVLACDFGVAFLAGLLIIPALYAAQKSGAEIFDKGGNFIEGPKVVFDVLPILFTTMGKKGAFILASFFILMLIAALTSSMSMLEVPVSYMLDRKLLSRRNASWWISFSCFLISCLLLLHMDWLFDWVIKLTTQGIQPGLSLVYCMVAGWLMKRNELAQALLAEGDEYHQKVILKILPIFFKYIVPLAIGVIMVQGWLIK